MPNAADLLEKSKKEHAERKAAQEKEAAEKAAAAATAAANAKAAANAAFKKPSAIQIAEQQQIRKKKMQEIAKQTAAKAADLDTAALQQTIKTKNAEISAKRALNIASASSPAPSAPPANASAPAPAPAKTNNAPKTNQAATNTTVAAVVGTTLFSSTPMSGGDALKIILIILSVGIVIYFIIKSRIIQNAYNKISSVPSDSNNASIRKDELTELSPQADEMAQQRVGVFEGFKARLDKFVNGGAKEGFLTASDLPTLPTMPSAITNVVSSLPTLPKLPVLPSTAPSASAAPSTSNTMRVVDSEQALVNYSVLGCRCAGYLGPKMNGVFSEEDAIQLAIKMGCRLFIFDIDYLDRAPSTPVLVCRDANGNLLSNNVGSIAKTAASIAAFTKKQRLASTDPIIIVLSVRRLPNKSATSKESIAYMQEIAAQLVPIQQYLMRSAPQGDVQQQRLEEVLFKLPIKTFENQILLLTNLDTRGFRQLDIEVAPARNLDILVHARVYTNENSALFYYSLPAKSATAAALVQTQEYYENIPPGNYESEADKTRNTWSMSMTAELEGVPDAAVLDVLVNQLGVQGIVIDPFADGAKESAVYTPEFFARRSYIPKPAEIAYKEPAVVTIAPPDKRLDANGGMLVSPTTN